MLPNDVPMLVSFLNTKLRDDDMSLEHIIEVHNGNWQEIMSKIDKHGYVYDEEQRQIKRK